MTTSLHARVGEVTERIVKRSRDRRRPYLDRIDHTIGKGPTRKKLGCANFAHGFAACGPEDKHALRDGDAPNLAIVTAYNDMLSAHQPFERFPELIKRAARAAGGTAQVAGGVPAMCDGVTQGEAGHGAVAVLARRDRAFDGGGALAPDVRRGGLSRRLRQDRAGPADRRALVRPSAGRVPARRADDLGPLQRRKVEDPPALRRGQGDAGRAAGRRGQGLSRPGHLHVLRHRQHQSDADGDHGPASARRFVRQSEHAVARRADGARRQARAGADREGQCLRADRPYHRRARRRQRRRRPACDRRLDQPDDPSDRDGGGGGDRARAGTISPIWPR